MGRDSIASSVVRAMICGSMNRRPTVAMKSRSATPRPGGGAQLAERHPAVPGGVAPELARVGLLELEPGELAEPGRVIALPPGPSQARARPIGRASGRG